MVNCVRGSQGKGVLSVKVFSRSVCTVTERITHTHTINQSINQSINPSIFPVSWAIFSVLVITKCDYLLTGNHPSACDDQAYLVDLIVDLIVTSHQGPLARKQFVL